MQEKTTINVLVISILIESWASSNLSKNEVYRSWIYSKPITSLTAKNSFSHRLQVTNLRSGPQSSDKQVFIGGISSGIHFTRSCGSIRLPSIILIRFIIAAFLILVYGFPTLHTIEGIIDF